MKNVTNEVIKQELEYGLAVWAVSVNTHLQLFDKVTNQALRVITGAVKSTPTLV